MKKYILLLFFGITITLNAQEFTVKLDVPDIRQKETQWCWAAVSQCVLAYYGYFPQQCEIAEYARTISHWVPLGETPCCDSVHDCNKAVYNCNEVADDYIIKNILMKFGNIGSDCEDVLTTSQIRYYLQRHRPFMIRRKEKSSNLGHLVVCFGIEGYDDLVHYMDPNPDTIAGGSQSLSYEKLLDNGAWKWTKSLTPKRSPRPDHCYNCYKDAVEDEIDCGGPCMPCTTAPKQKSFTTATDNLPAVARATEKITAGNATVRVLSGQEVSFITAEEGSIALLPGFEAKSGSNFTMQVKSNSGNEFTRICGKWCEGVLHCSRSHVRYKDHFRIFDLINAYKVEYEVTNIQTGRFVHKDIVYVDKNGTVEIWDCVTGETYFQSPTFYVVDLYIYPCNSLSFRLVQKIVVYDENKSSPEDPDDPENPETLLSPPINNIILQEEIASPYLSIIPNPNPGAFQLETNFSLSQISNLKIINSLGTTVYETQNLPSNTIQLPASASGLHFVIVGLTDGTALTQKMMIQR